MSVSCECCVFVLTGLCVKLNTRPEESYRMWCVWVWSWSLDNEQAVAYLGAVALRKERVLSQEHDLYSSLLRNLFPLLRFKYSHEHLFLKNPQSIYNRCSRTVTRSGLVGAHKNGSLCHIYSSPKPLSILVLPSEWQIALHIHIHNVWNYIAVCHLIIVQRSVPILQFSGIRRRVICYLIPKLRGNTLPPSSFLKY